MTKQIATNEVNKLPQKASEIVVPAKIIDAIKKGMPISLACSIDYDKTSKLIGVIIANFQNNLNVKEKMDADQIYTATNLLINEYGRLLRLEELKLALSKALTGKYFKFYERFDVTILFDILHAYDRDRTAELDKEYQKRKAAELLNEYEPNPKAVPMPPEIKAKFNQMANREKFNYQNKKYREYKEKALEKDREEAIKRARDSFMRDDYNPFNFMLDQ